MNELFDFFRFVVLFAFFVRIAIYTIKGGKEFSSNFVLLSYMVIWSINTLTLNLITNDQLFYLAHAFTPITLSLGLLLIKRVKVLWVIISSLAIGLILLRAENLYLFAASYFLAIALLLKQSLTYVRSYGRNLEKSSIYIFLSLSLFASFIVLVLKSTNYDWYQAQYLPYLRIVRLTIYSLTFIMIHVKFRRFFTY